ncbi:MAG: HipA domain-containing protein, partial [Desulfovibrionales bacterium]
RTGTVHSLLVERYDRVVLPESIIRVHQEDFCQALGIAPEIKYENEGGPAFRECCELLRKHSVSPAKDLLRITEWMFFNVLVGNADAHAKNLSLLYRQKAPSLAPSYDLLCTTIYEGLSQRMAMKVGGENRPAWIMKRHWVRLAEEAGVKSRIILERLQAFCARTEQELDPALSLFRDEYKDVETSFASEIADRVRSSIRETLKRLSGKA